MLTAALLCLNLACAHAKAQPEAEPPRPTPPAHKPKEPLAQGLPFDNGLIADDECGGLHWNKARLPLQVVFMDDISRDIWQGTLELSTEWWGGGLFEIVDAEELIATGTLPDIVIVADPEFVSSAVTFMNFNRETCVMRNALIVMPMLPGNAATHMMSHELGHALGLDHDSNPYSLMYPTVLEAELPKGDRERLEKLYGGPLFAVP